MQERAALVGASLEIESAVGRGTSIIVRIATPIESNPP
jgi:signal transduction histidine kinase